MATTEVQEVLAKVAGVKDVNVYGVPVPGKSIYRSSYLIIGFRLYFIIFYSNDYINKGN